MARLMLVGLVGCIPEETSKSEDEPRSPVVEVEVPPEDTGFATEPPGPPDISVDRESLDFGTLAVRTSITEVFHIANAGEQLLSLSSVALADGTGPFAVGTLDAAVLSPGESTTVSISYAPTEAGESQDLLVIESDDPDEPVVEVTLRGTALASLLSVSPSSVEFPPIALGCEAEQALTLSNVGSLDLTVADVQSTTTSDELVLDTREDVNGALPWTLAPGEERQVRVSYAPLDEVADTLTVVVESADPFADPVLIPVEGTGQLAGENVDIFEVSSTERVDILFAVDRSGSLSDEIDSLQTHMSDLVAELDAAGVDYQLAATVEDDGCINGSDLFIDSTVASADIETTISNMINFGAGYGSNTERAFMLMESALANTGAGDCNEGLVRDDAGLALVGFSDEAEQSTYGFAHYVALFQGLKADPAMVVMHGIGGPYPSGCGAADAYDGMYQATTATLGTFSSICTTDWETTMSDLGAHVATSGTWSANPAYALTQVPIPERITVSVDGVAVSSGWTYDPVDNAVTFDAASKPADGSTLSIAYGLLGDCGG